MVRRSARSLRRAWANKTELLGAGAEVVALRYQRASGDKKQEGKSVTDQGKENLREIRAHGWREGESYTDNARSASRHARKEREDFERLIEDIEAGRGDVLVVWEISRKERDLSVYVKIRDLCLRVGLNFWLVGGNLYDLRDKNDRMNLGIQAVQAEWLADSIRDNVQRGINLAAEAGRPHGKVTYGYRRIYHQRTKALLRQEPDDEVHEATGLDGTESTYSHCGVVREIFKRVAAGDSIVSIEHSLNDRGIPSPQHGQSGWLRSIVRKIAINPAYIGKRVLRGEVIGDGNWPALVDEETYWACVRRLEDPSRKTTRPARAVHLLSFIGKCAVCGGPLAAALARKGVWRGWTYRCQRRLCVAVRKEWLDEYIERIVVAWLTKADVHAGLHQPTTDKETAAARAEAQRLRTQLEGYKQLAEAGEMDPPEYARITRGLKAGIAAAEARAVERSLPPVLRGRIGKHAKREWAALADNLPVKREIIREILSIELLKAESNARTFNPNRLRLRWTYGDDTNPAPGATAPDAGVPDASSSGGRVPAPRRARAATTVTAADRPVWLLDVDGVLNATRPGWGAAPRNGRAWTGGVEYPIRWAPALVDRISAVHREGLVRIRWCSTWCADADQIENLLGLPRFERAWTEPHTPDTAPVAKLAAARAVLATGDRLIWTDDTETPTGGPLLDELIRDGRALLIAPATSRGLQPAHLDAIEQFTRAGHPSIGAPSRAA
jgi:DNA invertase Pin-like site-specific DNA recombinase